MSDTIEQRFQDAIDESGIGARELANLFCLAASCPDTAERIAARLRRGRGPVTGKPSEKVRPTKGFVHVRFDYCPSSSFRDRDQSYEIARVNMVAVPRCAETINLHGNPFRIYEEISWSIDEDGISYAFVRVIKNGIFPMDFED